jgi:low affinity Fe/Cu permease
MKTPDVTSYAGGVVAVVVLSATLSGCSLSRQIPVQIVAHRRCERRRVGCDRTVISLLGWLALVINPGTTIVTFLMVFLIQQSQNKDSSRCTSSSMNSWLPTGRRTII